MKTSKWIILLLLCAVTAGCYEEDALNLSDEPENIYGDYTLPQGNHAYDDYILDFYNKYGTLILYKYDSNDIYYNVASLIGKVAYNAEGKLVTAAWNDIPADENYIGQQLELLKDKWFGYFPDEMLRKLPKRIFLVSEWQWISNPANPTISQSDVYQATDYLLTAWGGARILTMTAAQKNTFKNAVISLFLEYLATTTGRIERSAAFHVLTNYTTPGAALADLYANGIIVNSTAGKTAAGDWKGYVDLITSTPYDALIDAAGTKNFLHASKDTRGVIRKKYDVMINYFRDKYGVDLQAIGNDVEI